MQVRNCSVSYKSPVTVLTVKGYLTAEIWESFQLVRFRSTEEHQSRLNFLINIFNPSNLTTSSPASCLRQWWRSCSWCTSPSWPGSGRATVTSTTRASVDTSDMDTRATGMAGVTWITKARVCFLVSRLLLHTSGFSGHAGHHKGHHGGYDHHGGGYDHGGHCHGCGGYVDHFDHH